MTLKTKPPRAEPPASLLARNAVSDFSHAMQLLRLYCLERLQERPQDADLLRRTLAEADEAEAIFWKHLATAQRLIHAELLGHGLTELAEAFGRKDYSSLVPSDRRPDLVAATGRKRRIQP